MFVQDGTTATEIEYCSAAVSTTATNDSRTTHPLRQAPATIAAAPARATLAETEQNQALNVSAAAQQAAETAAIAAVAATPLSNT